MSDWIDVVVPARKVNFPALCPNCLKPNPDVNISIASEQQDAKPRIVYTKYEYLKITVPHCSRCARTFSFWQSIFRASIVVGILLAVVLMVSFHLDSWTGWILIIPLCLPGILAQMLIKRSIRFVHFDDTRLGFKVKAGEYAEQLKALNP